MTYFNSKKTSIVPILSSFKETSFVIMVLEPDGIIGMHKANSDQLFIVAKGEGWICSDTSRRIPLKQGEGVLWKEGENHESGTETGMTVYIIEGKGFSFKV